MVHAEDWRLADPAGLPRGEMRLIRDEIELIELKIEHLFRELEAGS